MKATKERVNLYRESVIKLLENVGWDLVYDGSYIQSPGDGLWWETYLVFKKGGIKKIFQHSGTTRETLTYFVGARVALLYLADF